MAPSSFTLKYEQGAGAGSDARGSLEAYVLPLCAFAFQTSIARIGMDFLPSTTKIAWGLASLMLIAAVAAQPNLYLALARRNIVLVAASVFATLSGLWSLTPTDSAYSGILLVFNTFIGFLIADRVGIRRVIIFYFMTCLFWQSVSIILMSLHVWWAYDAVGDAKGVYLHKNAMALDAGMLYFTSLVLFASGWRRSISAAGVLIALLSLVLARSGTGFVLAFFTTSTLLICCIPAFGSRWSTLISGLLLMILAATLGLILLYDFDVSHSVLNALGKDATLTGRTILWDQALKSFSQNPWLGVGYDSFWNSPETTASSIWIIMGQILTSFHNVYLDRLVDVGAIGLSLFVLFMVTVLWRSWRRFLLERSAIWAWPFVYVCFITIDSLSEFPIFWNSQFQLLLAIIAAETCGIKLRSNADSYRLK
ncbi:MAG: O-antigen ligase family protein [Proteobacteria bacterium]|nr:O-antigen ligase family protein [Pseudomonadota bacterium]